MTPILALVRRDDLIADVDQISLLAWTNGLDLVDDGWQQASAAPTDATIVEAMTVAARGTTHDNLAAALQALDLKLKQVAWASDPQELYSVWLRAKKLNETNTRQAFIKSASKSPVALWRGSVDNPTGGQYYLEGNGLALERMPYWESITALDYLTGLSTLSTVGGKVDYAAANAGVPGNVPGDQPARLALLSFIGVNGGGGPLVKMWLGFRTSRFGNRANFQSTWALASASTFNVDTTGGAGHGDANAKSGFKAVCDFSGTIPTFGGPTLFRRVTMKVIDATANPTDQRGTYLVLLRAQLTAGASQVNVRLSDGPYSNVSMNTRDRVPITATSWAFYELGQVQIPSPGRAIGGLDSLSLYALAIDAERVAGTAWLEMDCLVLIPVDEGFVSADLGAVNGIGVQYVGGVSRPILVQDRPDGTQAAVWSAAGTPQAAAAVRITDGLPVGAGIAVVAGQRNGASTLSDTVSLELQVYPRWETLRGAS